MTPTGTRVLGTLGVLVGFGVLVAGAFVDSIAPFGALASGVGISSAVWLMVTGRTRPIAAAYELGVEHGRREAMREFNTRPPTRLRRQHTA